MENKLLRIAVDFDGTLCEFAFPEIGNQTDDQKKLMNRLIVMRSEGHKLILWTNRGDNEEYPTLTNAINWCRERGLEFDSVNENLQGQKKISGPSPKVMADIYIDDLAVHVNDWKNYLL